MADVNKIGTIFFEILKDLKEYLNDLVLVGGWAPYIYSSFLWGNPAAKLITTVDVDFGFGDAKIYPKTVFETLSALDYTERHPKMDRIYPVVLYKQGKIPIDFITSSDIKDIIIEKFIGRQININRIDNFNFLLEYIISIDLKNPPYKIKCPKPSAFLYHKIATFVDREDEQKKAKDLHYVYFILRFAPDLKTIFNEVIQYKKKGYFKDISYNLSNYFERESSPGCLMIEKENGPDEYIDNIRQDIFERFGMLKTVL